MKSNRWILGAALLAVLAFALVPMAAQANTPDKEAPDFTLKTHDGKELTLSKLKGKRGAVLVFFATWCPACMAEVPEVKAFVEAARDQNVLVYGVNLKQPLRVVQRFVKEKDVNYRILLDSDGAVAASYGITGIPTIIGIDGNGVVRYREHRVPRNPAKLLSTLTEGVMPEKKAETHDVKAVTRDELKALIDAGTENLKIVDVLSPESYHAHHVKGAINIPLSQLKSLSHKLKKDDTIITYCANFKCKASTRAAEMLQAMGYKNVRDFEGGIADWMEADYPTEKGESISFVDLKTLQAWKEKEPDLLIVDVLSPESYAKRHIAGAVNIPYGQLKEKAAGLDKDKRIVVYCANYVCQASSHAAELLQSLGFKNVHDFKGGLHEWSEAGQPLGPKMMK